MKLYANKEVPASFVEKVLGAIKYSNRSNRRKKCAEKQRFRSLNKITETPSYELHPNY